MSKIKILSEDLANQIAAGEVIERPASVVKEFVENAIDAGAKNISIQVSGDGSRLIRVVDDGAGMEGDDVLLSLERHATSKLDSSEQLFAINTLGFRGEAIPSIASVSRLTITSRPHDADLGCRAEVRYGRVFKVHDMGCPPGTVMEVKDLFGNVPARKKFLKSRQTELAHIDEVVKNYALVRPEVGFHCEMDGRVVLDLAAGAGGLERRVRQVICRSGSEVLVDLGNQDENNAVAVSGFLVAPDNSSGGTGGLRIFVNGRAVKDRFISNAVNEGLHNFLLKGKRAKGAIFLTMAPLDVDVNVHPAKHEVRFQRPRQVHEAVVGAVKKGMEDYQNKVRRDIFGEPLASPARKKEAFQEKEISAPVADIDKGKAPEKPSWPKCTAPEKLPFGGKKTREPQASPYQTKVVRSGLSRVENRGGEEEKAPYVETDKPLPEKIKRQALSRAQVVEVVEEAESSQENGRIRYLGHLFNSYIVCETENGLVLVDQHAAQERLIFEELRKQYSGSRIPSQALLFPEVVELSLAERRSLEQNREEIIRIGLDVKEFGGSSFIVQGVPAALSHLGPTEIVTGILARFSDEAGKGAEVRLEHVLAGMACKASIKAGQRLLPEEAEALLEQMGKAGIFSHCPHGRPVVKSFTKNDVKKWFMRT